MEDINTKKKHWSNFYREWKTFWRNPDITIYEKAVLFNVYLYRSDGEGWSISERKMANDLGISKETASKCIDALMRKCLVLCSRKERKRGKMRLAGFLRSPVWTTQKPNIWTMEKPSKYQREYQSNKDIDKSLIRIGTIGKALSGEELHKRIQKLQGSNKI